MKIDQRTAKYTIRQSLSVKNVICQNQKSQISNRLLIKLFKNQKKLSFIYFYDHQSPKQHVYPSKPPSRLNRGWREYDCILGKWYGPYNMDETIQYYYNCCLPYWFLIFHKQKPKDFFRTLSRSEIFETFYLESFIFLTWQKIN